MELSELAALVAEDPDSVDPFLVYADHLQEIGDPRGELISLELMRLEDPHDPERTRAVARHLDRHRSELLGPLIDLSACLSHAKWRLGFLHRVTLLHPEGATPRELASWVQLLLDAPAGRFIRELALTPLVLGDYTPVIDILATPGRSVRRLRIGPGQLQPVRLDLTGRARDLGHLEALALAATRIRLGRLVLPRLAELDLWIDTLTPEHVGDLATADWPALTSLSLAFRRNLADLPRLLHAPLPALERLRIAAPGAPELAGFVDALAESALAPQLRILSIAGAGFEEIEGLRDSAAAFESLERLVLETAEEIDRLRIPFYGREVEIVRLLPAGFDPWDEPTAVEDDPDEAADEISQSP